MKTQNAFEGLDKHFVLSEDGTVRRITGHSADELHLADMGSTKALIQKGIEYLKQAKESGNYREKTAAIAHAKEVFEIARQHVRAMNEMQKMLKQERKRLGRAIKRVKP